jgi:hypothetical protein
MSQLPTLLDNIKFEHPGFTLPFARLDPEVVFDLGELWFSGSLATHAQAICVLRALNHPPKTTWFLVERPGRLHYVQDSRFEGCPDYSTGRAS